VVVAAESVDQVELVVAEEMVESAE